MFISCDFHPDLMERFTEELEKFKKDYLRVRIHSDQLNLDW